MFSFRTKPKTNEAEPYREKSKFQLETRTNIYQQSSRGSTRSFRNWYQIRTRFSRENRVLDWYNFCLISLRPQELVNHLTNIFADQSTVFETSKETTVENSN